MSQEKQVVSLENFEPSLFEEIEVKYTVEGNVNLDHENGKRYVHTMIVNHSDFNGWDGVVAQNILTQEYKNKMCNFEKLKGQVEKTPVIKKFVDWFEKIIDDVFIPSIISDTKPFTVAEAITNENAEIRLLMLSCFEAENIIKELDSELLDEQTIIKTQSNTSILGSEGNYRTTLPKNFKSDQIVVGKKSFEDMYGLYRVPASPKTYINDQFYVKMKDTTSDKSYYLWIDPAQVNEDTPDAIDAIASTVFTLDTKTFEERRLTKEEYLLINEET